MINISVSFILRIIDSFTRKPINPQNTMFRVNNIIFTPFVKEGIYFVFTGIDGESAKISIISTQYNFEEFFVKCDKHSEVKNITLNPSKNYVFNSNVGKIMGICNGNTSFKAYINRKPEIFKVAQDDMKIGDDKIILYSSLSTTNFPIPGKFMILDKDSAKAETCFIEYNKEEVFILENPLVFGHTRGTALVTLIEGITNENGEFFIAFDLSLDEKMEVIIIFEENGKERKIKSELTRGQSVNL